MMPLLMHKKSIYKLKPKILLMNHDSTESSLIRKENEQSLLGHKQFLSKKQKQKVKHSFSFD